jgi:hypothetical protein
MAKRKETYYFCLYHVYSGNQHVNYHHVIIKTDNPRKLVDINTDQYQYYRKSYEPLDQEYVESQRKKDRVYEGLIRDGESLWKRMQKTNTSNKEN